MSGLNGEMMRERRRRWLFWLWLGGILFPLAFAVQYWDAARQVFAYLFAPRWVHVVMHAFLYAILAALGEQVLFAGRRKALAWIFGFVLLVGVVQEGLQLLPQRSWPGWWEEVFDVSVDVGGAALGLWAGRIWRRKNAPLGGVSGGEGGI